MDEMIGKRIKARRKELQITQTQIQAETSVTSGNLSCIENGKYLPSAPALIELSRILDCSIDWILTGESKISNNHASLDILDSKDIELLNLFHTMDERDKAELIAIAHIKCNKEKNNQIVKSSHLKNDTPVSETA